MTRTYAISQDPGFIHRLDSLAGPWTDISLPLTFNGQFYDVKTGSSDPDSPIVVGTDRTAFSWFGIYRSTDAGVTWASAAGNYQGVSKTWYQLSWLSQNIVFASADMGFVAASTDGGATFTLTTGFPTPSGVAQSGSAKCLHFISPTTGVVGFGGSIFKTTDAGATWTYLNGGIPLTTPKPVTDLLGIHIDATQNIITALGREAIYRSTDAGATFTLVFDFTANQGRHLTWINDTRLWAIADRDMRMSSTDGGATWTVLSPYNSLTGPFQNGGHFYNAASGFYSSGSNVMFTNDSGTTGVISDTMPAIVKITWTLLDPDFCYRIQRCDTGNFAVVGQDLSAYIGQVIEVQNHTCWTVIGPTECINPVSIIILNSFDECRACTNPPVTCWILTDCDTLASPVETIQVSTNLSLYVGDVVQIEGSDKCWVVSEAEDCECPVEVVVTYSSTTCELCPAPVPEKVRVRKISPGNPPACDLDLLIEVTTSYADAWYKEVLSKRFGINVCCEYDLDMAFVKWEVVHLQMLHDPLICCQELASPGTFTCT